MMNCLIEDCGKPSRHRGWCYGHYHRWQRHGDALAGTTPNGEPMRFLLEVAVPCTNIECLYWPFSTNGNGYGQIWHEGRLHIASRLTCAMTHGPAPTPEHEAAHSCGKGHEGCINGSHLSWKTPKENDTDKLAHGTCSRGERHGNAKLTESDVRQIIELRGKKLQHEIAAAFGIARATVSGIHSRRAWSWLDDRGAS